MIKKILCALAAAAMLLQPAAQAVTRQKIDARMFSDEKYIFRIQGSDKKFLLLDESDDTESKFFVVALDYYGEKAYHNGGKSKFDPKDPESIAYYLNNDFIKNVKRLILFSCITNCLPFFVIKFKVFANV